MKNWIICCLYGMSLCIFMANFQSTFSDDSASISIIEEETESEGSSLTEECGFWNFNGSFAVQFADDLSEEKKANFFHIPANYPPVYIVALKTPPKC